MRHSLVLSQSKSSEHNEIGKCQVAESVSPAEWSRLQNIEDTRLLPDARCLVLRATDHSPIRQQRGAQHLRSVTFQSASN